MKKRNLKSVVTISCLLITSSIFSQNIGINATGLAPAASAGLDVDFTNKGLLIPRVALTGTGDLTTIASATTSLLIYNTATAGISPNNVSPGYYYWDGTKWIAFGGSGGKDWSLTGNAGTTVGTNYIGTSDAKDLVFKTNANEQMRINTSGFLGINETNPTGAYLVVRSGTSANDGIKVTHTSSVSGAAFNTISGTLSNAAYTNASGYLGYHNSNNKTYSVYGTGGDLAGYFDGRVAINSVSTDITTYDLEVRDKGSANPVDVLFRRKDLVTVAGTEITNLDFGDNTNALAQASLKVIREFASSGATDLPTAFTFSTMADGANALTERMRLNNAGFLGIGTTNPLQKLHVADDIIIGGGQNADFDGNTEHLKIWAQSKVWNVGVVNDPLAANSDFFISRTDGTNDGTLNIDPNGNVGINTVNATHKLHTVNTTTTTDVGAVYGKTTNTSVSKYAYGILGYNTNDINAVIKQIGVYGNSGTGDIAIAGRYSSTNFGYIGSSSYGLYARHNVVAGQYAAYFQGDVHVNGNLSKTTGSFKIDHPLDPANKYLYHSFVESPDMMNIYNGNIITDANGNATITLPNYFDALNIDFRYQLTAIGQFSQVIVSEKIKNNQFKIKSSIPNVEVSWQVTGIRNDPYAKKHRIKVEVEKEPKNKGKYLNPFVYGKTEKEGIGFDKINDNETFNNETEKNN